nr:tRNA lysidine(34) synthetase TilS [uncultured Cetobacterium sp.]
MLRKVLKKIKSEKLIKNGDKIVLGFSGGPDSVFLLEALLHAQQDIDFQIVLAHVNHLLRGKDSDEDENFVKLLGEKLKLPTFIKRAEVEKEAAKHGIGLEEAGREIRYSFFEETLKEVSGNKIAIAHNLDDQIENFLFRMIRGCSLEGLEGINHRNNLIRPINEIYKGEIMDYLDSNNIQYRIDKTNFENEFTRNSIRLDLIPYIENRYNPNFKEKIYNLMEEIREANNLLKVDLNRYLIDYEDKKVLSIKILLNENSYIQRKVINEYLKGYSLDISREKIQNIIKVLELGGSKELHLTKKLSLKKQYDNLWIEERKKLQKEQVKRDTIIEVEVPFDIIFNGYRIKTEYSENSFGQNEFMTNLAQGDSLIIRTRKDGDKMIPLGMKSYKKIKDIFINEKIAKEERDIIPIIEKNNEILWVSGIKKSEVFKGEKNKKGIKLIIRRQNEE